MTNKEILKLIIDKIKSEMNDQHFSQGALAQACTEKIHAKDPKAKGISQSTISNILKKPSNATLSNILKICDGLDLSLFSIFRSINNSIASDNNNLIYNISDSAFKGYVSNSKMYIYFLSTENNLNDELLYAELYLNDFYHTNECIARLQINTNQHINPNAEPRYKNYEGNMIIYHNNSIFMHLISQSTGDVWSLIFNHDDLNSTPSLFSLGCAVTLSAGKGHRHPTIHFVCLCSKKLSSDKESILKNILRIHGNHISISAKNLNLFFKDKTIDDSFKFKLQSIINEKPYPNCEWNDASSYSIPIKNLEPSSPFDSKNTYEAISKLLRYSSNASSYSIDPGIDSKLKYLLDD